MTNYDVCVAFAKGNAARCLNMHSTGDGLFSYNTCIAQRKDKRMILNLTKYSRSTSKQQHDMKTACDGFNYETVDNIERNTQSLF